LDKLDRQFEIKKFLRAMFNNIAKDEYIRLYQNNENYQNISYWNDIDELNNYIEVNRFGLNTYFNLATTDGEEERGGTTEHLKYRYFLAWDFDKKTNDELDAKEIMFRFKKLNLWYHALIDSGHGYHAYMVIEKTDNLNMVEELTKAIGLKLGADPEAMKKTQILRIPYTFNIKEPTKIKQVNTIKLFDKSTIKPYKLNRLYKDYCSKISKNRTITYALNKTKFPPCIKNILKGVIDGNRNFALKRIVSFLKLQKYTEPESRNIIEEWNYKNDTPEKEKELEYQFNYIWNRDYICFGCITDDITLQSQIMQYCELEKCKSNSKEDILFIEGDTIQLEYKLCKKLETQRKDIFKLNGNDLLLISILKKNNEGLNTKGIIKELTYDNKCSLSRPTLVKSLKHITDNGYTTKIIGNKRKGEQDFYKFNLIKCIDIEKINLSYFAVLGVIAGNISSEDLKIYCYIRYRYKKGLSLTQEKLAIELGISQQAISKHINNLIKKKYLNLKYVDYSINPLGSNVYSINY